MSNNDKNPLDFIIEGIYSEKGKFVCCPLFNLFRFYFCEVAYFVGSWCFIGRSLCSDY